VGFGLALLSHAGGELVGLMQVVRNRTEVVEELAEQVPAAVLAHHTGAQEEIAVAFDGVRQKQFLAVKLDVGQAFIGRGQGTVGRLGGGGEPALVDAAAMATQYVKVARVQLQADRKSTR